MANIQDPRFTRFGCSPNPTVLALLQRVEIRFRIYEIAY